ncbi:MAG: SCO family protein [Bacteroidetes bacterium]|nr:MAG: SCO family protein [Bacteroidota bacterium]
MNRIWFLIIFSIAGITFTYFMIRPKEKEELPFINPTDIEEEMVDPELLRIGYGHTIGSFSFKDQNGKTISDADIKGKVFVAEYFFTTCQTICPVMNTQMQRVQKALKGEDDFKILSFTVDPDTDTVEQMKRYAIGHKADDDQWKFLTGKKEDLYTLARKSFFVLKPAEAENQGDVGSDFIHTNNFVLVDQQMRIRGYYDGTSTKEVDKLIHDIHLLLGKEHED